MATPVSLHALLMEPFFMCADITGYFSSSSGHFCQYLSGTKPVTARDASILREIFGHVDSKNIQLSI